MPDTSETDAEESERFDRSRVFEETEPVHVSLALRASRVRAESAVSRVVVVFSAIAKLMGMVIPCHLCGNIPPERCVMLKRFMREEDGATMVEYGLMIALIAVVLIVIVSTLGQNLKGAFSRTNTGVVSANSADASAAPGDAVTAPAAVVP
jgi:pilus assembly protein Flp/PilA